MDGEQGEVNRRSHQHETSVEGFVLMAQGAGCDQACTGVLIPRDGR